MCKVGKEGVVEGISLLIVSLSPPTPLTPPPPLPTLLLPTHQGKGYFVRVQKMLASISYSALYWTTRHIRANFSEIFSPLYSEIGHPNVMIKTRHCNLGYFLVLIGFFPSI